MWLAIWIWNETLLENKLEICIPANYKSVFKGRRTTNVPFWAATALQPESEGKAGLVERRKSSTTAQRMCATKENSKTAKPIFGQF
jgi:hypothetical protein